MEKHIDENPVPIKPSKMDTPSDFLRVFDIKIAQVQDSGVIAHMERETFSNPWGELSVRSWIKMENADFLIAYNAQSPVGYIGYHKAFDIAEIDRIAVSLDLRRHGVASLLINRFLDEIKKDKISKIYLDVRESNTSAFRLYSVFGFKQVGKRKGYYVDTGEDAILMELCI